MTKLQAYQDSESTRHLDDIESIMLVSGLELDLSYVDHEAAKMAGYTAWRGLLEKIRGESALS